MTTYRTGSPFSYARFRDSGVICGGCVEFGTREYAATFREESSHPLDRRICDVCVDPKRPVVSVTVTLPPFIDTPQEIRRCEKVATLDSHGRKIA